MDMYWNNKFINKSYIWGFEESLAARMVIQDMQKLNIDKCMLLDIGCGYGRDVVYFEKNNHSAYGIDNAEEAIRLGKERWNNIKIECQDVFQYNTTKKFEVITCNFFIHLLDKDERIQLVDKIMSLLKDEGIAYFTVSSDMDCDFNDGKKIGDNLVTNSRGVTKFYYNSAYIKQEFALFSDVEFKEFREKHYHDYEHEHVNYFIKCKKGKGSDKYD